MRYVILGDGTRIDNCSNSTTSHSILALRDTYANAGAVRDIITQEAAEVVKVFNEDDTVVETGTNLKLVDGANLIVSGEDIICEITLADKTEIEILQDQIAELQEVIIGG